MSKLLARLRDPARSGVYRASTAQTIEEATRSGGLDVVRIDAAGGTVFEAMARALHFPAWFGGNWDALEDCLSDLSWREGDGRVLLLLRAPTGEALGTLIDVLSSAAQYWAGRGRPFFAVFVDAERKLALPDLYRDA